MPLAGKPISRYRPYRQQPGWRASHAIIKPPLYQFVLLSMLVHALAITLFGAPSGGSREGRALWGSLQVVLQGAEPEAGPALRLDRSVDRLRAAPKARRAPRVEPVAPPRVEPPPPSIEPAPKEAPPFSMPPLLDRIVKPDRKLQLPAPLKVPPPTAVQRPPAPIIPAQRPAAKPGSPAVGQPEDDFQIERF